jgi:hypothetical protein
MSYQNYTPNYSNKYRNLSYFRNTDFTSNDDFIENGLPNQTHVTLWEVDGIGFTNCHFSNEITSNKNNSSSPNRGIYSINAGFKVIAGCDAPFLPIGQPCPNNKLLKSSFKGLETAVEATGAGTTETATIRQADFEDNVWGVVIDELDNVSVNRNAIEVGDASYTLFWPLGAGVMVDNSTVYFVDDLASSITGCAIPGDNWCRVDSEANVDPTVMAHEVGHLLNLWSHSNDPNNLMYAFTSGTSYNLTNHQCCTMRNSSFVTF